MLVLDNFLFQICHNFPSIHPGAFFAVGGKAFVFTVSGADGVAATFWGGATTCCRCCYGGAFAFEMLNYLCILDGNTLRSKLIKPSYFPLYWLFNHLRHDKKGCLQRHG